jgi:hypothetical protein
MEDGEERFRLKQQQCNSSNQGDVIASLTAPAKVLST